MPLLPCVLIEYLEAPHPFIMGLNSKYLDQINNENDVIVVNIDTGKLIVPELTVELIDFPKANISLLKGKLNEIGFINVQKKILTRL